jgi:hypothetical protein
MGKSDGAESELGSVNPEQTLLGMLAAGQRADDLNGAPILSGPIPATAKALLGECDRALSIVDGDSRGIDERAAAELHQSLASLDCRDWRCGASAISGAAGSARATS